MFQQYPQNDVNESIPLHEGTFRVRAGDHRAKLSGSAYLRWLPSPHIAFDMEITEPSAGFDLDSLTVELPGFTTKNVVPTSMRLGPTYRIRALAGTMEWGGERRLLSVGFQIANFCNFNGPGPPAVPGDPTAIAGNHMTMQAVALKHDGWQISLVAVPESQNRYRNLKATGGYAFTHVGQLTRTDASTFSVEQAKDVLESLRVFLSFARGAACNLPIQWGRGIDGEIVWRWFASPVVDRWKRGYSSWFPEIHGEILAELFDPFCRSHKDQKLGEPLVLAAHWYRRCNTNSSGMEGSIVLGMAALELLGTLVVVERNASMAAEEYDRLSSAKKLQDLLSALNVQPEIPQRYEALAKFAESGNWNSCQALAKLRNGFVHAHEQNRRIVFGAAGKAATPDAWQLSLWYQELALLHLLGHHGHYANRATATWEGQAEPVPWSTS